METQKVIKKDLPGFNPERNSTFESKLKEKDSIIKMLMAHNEKLVSLNKSLYENNKRLSNLSEKILDQIGYPVSNESSHLRII